MNALMMFACVVGFAALMIWLSIHNIGQTQVGLATKRFSFKKLADDCPIAFHGEAGYQADLLMPGHRFKFWLLYEVTRHPWVQVPPGEIGVVIAQIGKPLPIGAKSAVYKDVFGNFASVDAFVRNGGEKGVQRPVLPPGALAPIHPVAFLVITRQTVFGVPVSEDLRAQAANKGGLTPAAFGLQPEQLMVRAIKPQPHGDGEGVVDVIGVVMTFEGRPDPSGAMATRLGGFDDIRRLEERGADDGTIIEAPLTSKNESHNGFQNFQKFVDDGGCIGLQHDPLTYGAYCLNPFLVQVELFPMLVVKQGEVGVIKTYIGLETKDVSGDDFKHGSLVVPGHRGIWREPLHTGKFALNPRIYQAETVPTAILTLNWAEANSTAHNLDHALKQIQAKSREGFPFAIDLQVQIHVPDKMAPKVISSVGTMQNLVNEVLQAAVGNHFRDKLQTMQAIEFIEKRQEVQTQAFEHIRSKLCEYNIETRGVYIQDVVFPAELVNVLQDREIANQRQETYDKQRLAEEKRVTMEKQKGLADMQSDLARSAVTIDIRENEAKARQAAANGEAYFIAETGRSKAAEVEAVGMAHARAYKEQVAAMGEIPTVLVNVLTALGENKIKLVPDTMVVGAGGAIDGLAAVATEWVKRAAANGTPSPRNG